MERKEFLFTDYMNVSNREYTFDTVIVFGSGEIGKIVIYMLKLQNISVISCFDNKPSKMKMKLWNNIPCTQPIFIDKNIPIFICVNNLKAKEEIRKQCEALGYIYILDVNVLKLYQCFNHLPDKEFLQLQYYLRMNGKILNLENPRTFNEKIQWLKLYNHNLDYTVMVDKYKVKKYVADIIGEEYIIPTLGVWSSFDDIVFKQLPNQFVLKCTHDSGSVFVINNKKDINYAALAKKFERLLQINYYQLGREWAYKNVIPRIIAEKFLENKDNNQLKDYKFMCFNGKVMCSFICTNRFSEDGLNVTFYDKNWNKMPFERHYPSDKGIYEKPYSYNEMLELSEKLSKDIPFARIDFYEVNRHPYFGEITLYPGCGYEEFIPEKWDWILGSWIKLPEKMTINNNESY